MKMITPHDASNIIYINPGDVMRLSSFEACIFYQCFNGKIIPENPFITEEERSKLNAQKPRYVSYVHRQTLPEGGRLDKREGDFILSIKSPDANRNIYLYFSTSTEKIKLQKVANLCPLGSADILMASNHPSHGLMILDVELVVLNAMTDEYDLIKKFTAGSGLNIRGGILSFLAWFRMYTLISLDLKIDVVKTLSQCMINAGKIVRD
jgi:hypothetical protein